MTIERERFLRWLDPQTTFDAADCEAAMDAAAHGDVVRLTEGEEVVAYYQMTDGIPQEVPA